eukprot:CAMPEP_0167764262 /NCGR_PEP_ID=MMETSP0110_2-20121227/13916_1 /TAXON_ID=629695 /ORGANISM="Gymnochlora sp., Strain CCMP2014" /LENGTH=441 /DNA_ID=CAMNT_0007651609 /DNA_START=19 /DNA_END=1341 /DNA_ORIENTATION=+
MASVEAETEQMVDAEEIEQYLESEGFPKMLKKKLALEKELMELKSATTKKKSASSFEAKNPTAKTLSESACSILDKAFNSDWNTACSSDKSGLLQGIVIILGKVMEQQKKVLEQQEKIISKQTKMEKDIERLTKGQETKEPLPSIKPERKQSKQSDNLENRRLETKRAAIQDKVEFEMDRGIGRRPRVTHFSESGIAGTNVTSTGPPGTNVTSTGPPVGVGKSKSKSWKKSLKGNWKASRKVGIAGNTVGIAGNTVGIAGNTVGVAGNTVGIAGNKVATAEGLISGYPMPPQNFDERFATAKKEVGMVSLKYLIATVSKFGLTTELKDEIEDIFLHNFVGKEQLDMKNQLVHFISKAKCINGPLPPKVHPLMLKSRLEIVKHSLQTYVKVAKTPIEAQQVFSEMMKIIAKAQSYQSNIGDPKFARMYVMALAEDRAKVNKW